MTEKSTTIKVGTNALRLPFCSDKHGITSMMKKEGVRTIGRINGSDDKLNVVLHTLKVLAAYAKEKHAQQQEQHRTRLAAEAKVYEKAEADAEKIRQASIKTVKAQLEYLEGKAPK
jgi:hypothetical protein